MIENEEPIVYYKYLRNGKELVTPSLNIATTRTDESKVEKWRKRWKNKDSLTVRDPELLGIIKVEEE